MTLPRVLVEIIAVFKFMWTLFTVDSPKPLRLPLFSNPFRLLNLPSLAHDVIFSQMEIEDIYHLSKCSRRSRYAVKMFTRRQKYDFEIFARKFFCSIFISNRSKERFHRKLRLINVRELFYGLPFLTYSEDVWAATKEEIGYVLDVFTKKVNWLKFDEISNVRKMTEFLKEKTVLPVHSVVYAVREINDEMYKSVWREFKDVKKLDISASPSANFRFDDMEPFTGDNISIRDADCLTFDNLTRCFMNVERVWLWTTSERYLNVPVFNQFLNAWRNGLRVGKLEWICAYINIDLQSIFKDVPATEVKRVEVRSWKRVFKNGECFLIRQEASGAEAVVYCDLVESERAFCFTTKFRLLRDQESDEEYSDNSDFSDDEF